MAPLKSLPVVGGRVSPKPCSFNIPNAKWIDTLLADQQCQSHRFPCTYHRRNSQFKMNFKFDIKSYIYNMTPYLAKGTCGTGHD